MKEMDNWQNKTRNSRLSQNKTEARYRKPRNNCNNSRKTSKLEFIK